MNALINQCKKRGNGLPKVYLENLRECFKHTSIEENEIKDGYSYFPIGMKRNVRIAKIAFDNRNRIYLEFNYVVLEEMIHLAEFQGKVWKLTEKERISLHALGVSYCYVGEDISFAKELIELAKKTHSKLNVG
jgi:hypothetical protein